VIHLYPPPETAGADCAASPELDDLSYEDAVLDTQARLIFRAELGQAEAPNPELAFSKLMARVQAANDSAPEPVSGNPAPALTPVPAKTAAPRTPFLPQLASAIRLRISGVATSRLTPSMMALILVLMVLGSDAVRILQSDPGFFADTPPVRTVLAPGGSDPVGTQPPPQANRQPSTIRVPYNTTDAMLHPFEVEPLDDTRSGMGQHNREEAYRRARFGPK
jgi:hypothetical protein